jgi:hypothetical protein
MIRTARRSRASNLCRILYQGWSLSRGASSKPENSKPGATPQPTSVHAPRLIAFCQQCTGTANCGRSPAKRSGPRRCTLVSLPFCPDPRILRRIAKGLTEKAALRMRTQIEQRTISAAAIPAMASADIALPAFPDKVSPRGIVQPELSQIWQPGGQQQGTSCGTQMPCPPGEYP